MTKHDLEAGGLRADRPKRRHDSSIQLWRRQREEGALKGVSGEKQVASGEMARQRAKEKAEREKLERENARLKRSSPRPRPLWRSGKMARALGNDVRERGLGQLLTELRAETREQLEPHVGIQRSCTLTGINRSSLYRHRQPKEVKPVTVRPAPPNALSAEECEELIAVLNSKEFADKSPRQVWATLLDRGTYLASVSTMHRVLRARGLVRERRAQARHEAKKKPHLVARSPHEVWSWDITRLPSIERGKYFDLYVMIDIFPRYVVLSIPPGHAG